MVGPVYLSEKLEEFETSRPEIIPTSEIISSSTSDTIYLPYLEMNQSNYGWHSSGDTHLIYYTGLEWIYDDLPVTTYNYVGYQDLTVTTYVMDSWNIYIHVDIEEMFNANINFLSWYVEASEYWTMNTLQFRMTTESGGVREYLTLETFDDTNTGGYGVTYNYTLTSEDFTNIMSTYDAHKDFPTSPCHPTFVLIGTMEDMDRNLITDFQINPEYFEIVETTYVNQTITTYEPYYLNIQPVTVHKVFMGAGGVLLLLVALVLSPLPIGEYFERFFPIYKKKVRS